MVSQRKSRIVREYLPIDWKLFRGKKYTNMDSYDVVVRLNWHWRKAKSTPGSAGKRTDIVCHCLNPDQIAPNDLNRFKMEKVKLLFRNDGGLLVTLGSSWDL